MLSKDLLRQYRENPSNELRNRIVVDLLPLVKSVAAKVMRARKKSNNMLAYEDLVAEGVLAMIDHVPRYDPNRDLAVSTFFRWRILGGMLDAMRRADHLTRSQRKNGSPHNSILSLDQVRTAEGETILDSVTDSRRSSCCSSQQDEDDFWREVCKGMPQHRRLALLMRYRLGMEMREISGHLGVSQGRVSQMMAEIIRDLQARGDQWKSNSDTKTSPFMRTSGGTPSRKSKLRRPLRGTGTPDSPSSTR